MPTATESLRSKIAAFLTEIESLTRLAALDAVRAALSGNAPTRAPRAKGRRFARRAATKRAAPKGKRANRTAEDVAVLNKGVNNPISPALP